MLSSMKLVKILILLTVGTMVVLASLMMYELALRPHIINRIATHTSGSDQLSSTNSHNAQATHNVAPVAAITALGRQVPPKPISLSQDKGSWNKAVPAKPSLGQGNVPLDMVHQDKRVGAADADIDKLLDKLPLHKLGGNIRNALKDSFLSEVLNGTLNINDTLAMLNSNSSMLLGTTEAGTT